MKKYTKKQIAEAIAYWKKQLREMNEAEYPDATPEDGCRHAFGTPCDDMYRSKAFLQIWPGAREQLDGLKMSNMDMYRYFTRDRAEEWDATSRPTPCALYTSNRYPGKLLVDTAAGLRAGNRPIQASGVKVLAASFGPVPDAFVALLGYAAFAPELSGYSRLDSLEKWDYVDNFNRSGALEELRTSDQYFGNFSHGDADMPRKAEDAADFIYDAMNG